MDNGNSAAATTAGEIVLWRTEALLNARKQLHGRPAQYDGLLLEPVVDDPSKPATSSYKGWELHHANVRRFYVSGLLWFNEVFKANQLTWNRHRTSAHTRVQQLTNWAEMPNNDGFWKKELGRPQVIAAFGGLPVQFAKAAQLLMTAELIAEEILVEKLRSPDLFEARGIKLPEGFSDPADIHKYMGILPACWNIDNFSEDYVRAVNDATHNDLYAKVAEMLGLRNAHVVGDLTRGHTVTLQVALAIHDYISKNYSVPNVYLGKVRAHPGTVFLGRKHASERERPELL